jgi:uncharacterized damage-inducible protein DinB
VNFAHLLNNPAARFFSTGVYVSHVPIWFERKFEFTFPVELYPNLCVRLRGTPTRLEEMVRDCSRERLVKKLQDKWSAQEHAGHMLDLESLWLARVEDFSNEGTDLTAADLSNQKTHQANHNAREIHEILAEFRRERLKLMDRLAAKDTAEFARSMLHPRLKKPMRLVDHLYFVAEHDDHHLAWIWEQTHRQ